MQIHARESRVTSVRPAASVVLVREDGAVLWVRRGDQLRFAGGFYAFPGGSVDLQDSGVPTDGGEALGAARVHEAPPAGGFAISRLDPSHTGKRCRFLSAPGAPLCDCRLSVRSAQWGP